MFPDFSPLLTELQQALARRKPASFVALCDESLRQCRFVMGERWTAEQWADAFIQHWIWAGVFMELEEDFCVKNQLASDFQRLATAFVCHEKQLRQKAIITAAIKQQLAKAIGKEDRKALLLQLIFDFYRHYYPTLPEFKPQNSGFIDFCIRQSDFVLQRHFNISIYNKNTAILDATGDWLGHNWASPVSGLVGSSPWLLLQYYYFYTNKQAISWAMPCEQAHYQQNIGTGNSLFGSDLSENALTLQKQNEQKMDLVWANLTLPLPLDSKTLPQSDQRLRESFAKHSQQAKPKVYSPEARLFRWAMDRAKPMGMAVLLIPSAFVSDANWDGLRCCIAQETRTSYCLEMGEKSLLMMVF